eukprot:TRINITY_DN17314_c0_g1_i1.p1 TRINITY_DN17314_c0_g1~~TRINITY_DN17314_c0_g1_i1.p1  ORF type:complete len:178 (-),score=19.54 TRINITY_DN17314_c0_g1_i1:258-791(-)
MEEIHEEENKKKSTKAFNYFFSLMFLPISIGVGIFFVYVFFTRKDKVSCNQPIPLFIGIMGIAYLAMVLITIVNFIITLCSSRKQDDYYTLEPSRNVADLCVSCISFLMGLFVFVMLILGSVWTFSIKITQCDPFIYNVSFYYLIITWSIFGFSLLMSCLVCCCCIGLISAKKYDNY